MNIGQAYTITWVYSRAYSLIIYMKSEHRNFCMDSRKFHPLPIQTLVTKHIVALFHSTCFISQVGERTPIFTERVCLVFFVQCGRPLIHLNGSEKRRQTGYSLQELVHFINKIAQGMIPFSCIYFCLLFFFHFYCWIIYYPLQIPILILCILHFTLFAASPGWCPAAKPSVPKSIAHSLSCN